MYIGSKICITTKRCEHHFSTNYTRTQHFLNQTHIEPYKTHHLILDGEINASSIYMLLYTDNTFHRTVCACC